MLTSSQLAEESDAQTEAADSEKGLETPDDHARLAGGGMAGATSHDGNRELLLLFMSDSEGGLLVDGSHLD